MTNTEIIDRIRQLKKEKNAVILAHYYTRPEVQDIADYLGDSLGLSQEAGKTDARIIVFCGVHFMAETAAIISPDKKILIPASGAGCSLAESITGYELREWKKANPDGIIVSYVNTTAEVKAWTDICCTSANALKVVQSIPPDHKILFVPDKKPGSLDQESYRTGNGTLAWRLLCTRTHHHRHDPGKKPGLSSGRYPHSPRKPLFARRGHFKSSSSLYVLDGRNDQTCKPVGQKAIYHCHRNRNHP